MPDRNQIIHIIMGLRQIMFPGYFEKEHLGQTVPEYFVGHSLIRIHDTLSGQILSAFQQANAQASTSDLAVRVEAICDRFFSSLAPVQKTLMKDVQAAFDGDPAAKTKEEIIFCYPGLLAIFIYRIAHLLYQEKVPFIPRIMTEYAHSHTGIDINPGATIGEYFFIDHGTGVVIGETTEIGDHVKVGDFVEIKNSVIGNGTKISHLTYVGDSDCGERVNFGCGTVTTNYDGFRKYRCTIGDDSFIGCNTNLVAPVKVGKGSYIAAGSSITDDVPADALALARTKQTVKEGWAARRRALLGKKEK